MAKIHAHMHTLIPIPGLNTGKVHPQPIA